MTLRITLKVHKWSRRQQLAALGRNCDLPVICRGKPIICRRFQASQVPISGLLAHRMALPLMMGLDTLSLALSIVTLLIFWYAYGAAFVGSERLINQPTPAHCHARLLSYFYMTVYLFNAVPISLGLMVDAFDIYRAVTGSLLIFIVVGVLLLGAIIRMLSPKQYAPS